MACSAPRSWHTTVRRSCAPRTAAVRWGARRGGLNPVAEHETAVEQRQSITHITHRGHHRPRHSHSDANFDWDAIDKQGADVRKANCTGELGSYNFDWASVDAKGADVRSPNMPANIDADAFDKVDLAGADVRKPNCTGQIGDADFNALIKKEQTPLTALRAGEHSLH